MSCELKRQGVGVQFVKPGKAKQHVGESNTGQGCGCVGRGHLSQQERSGPEAGAGGFAYVRIRVSEQAE